MIYVVRKQPVDSDAATENYTPIELLRSVLFENRKIEIFVDAKKDRRTSREAVEEIAVGREESAASVEPQLRKLNLFE